MKFQIGKQGVTEGTITSLTNAFKKHKLVRINILPNADEDRRTYMKKVAEELVSKLKGNYTYRLIGFVIILQKVNRIREA